MVQHLDTHKLMSKDQHGFVKGRSCLTNLLETLDDITSSLDEGEGMDMVFLDYKKAFDTVPHKRLLYKSINMVLETSTLIGSNTVYQTGNKEFK